LKEKTVSHQIPVASVEDLTPGQRKLAFIDGRSIVLFNIGGTIRAIDNSCPHNGASLASGKLDGTMLTCPAHGLRIDVTTGCTPGAHPLCVKTFPVQVADGKLHVLIEEQAGI
jgi:3-phenylpropionate/trans-cinnamate dioxygenase ferredoxin component